MLNESSDVNMLLALPDDVFVIVCRFLFPRDLCNLSICCQNLYTLVASDKVWFAQCEKLKILQPHDLNEWRRGFLSYKAFCRFLINVQPLMGIWVHQNPELGNVVYVMPGYVSVVGCRVIPQELGPLGMEDGPLLWAPVFEIIADVDGSPAFFLHGREKGSDYIYPGFVKPVNKNCNVMLLEIEPTQQKNRQKLMHSKSTVHYSDKELSRKVRRSDSGLAGSQRLLVQGDALMPFSRLAFSDRRRLLEIVTSQVRCKVSDETSGPIFPRLRDDGESFQKDLVLLYERRLQMLRMIKLGGDSFNWKENPKMPLDPRQLDLREIGKNIDCSNGLGDSVSGDDAQTQCIKRKTIGSFFRDSLKQILGKSSSINSTYGPSKYSSSSSENKHALLHDFLRSSDTMGLALHACAMKLSSYRSWPNMHDNRFALYKLPLRAAMPDQEYAGLWGGTFGWPPGKPSEDKPGKALFFLLLSYEECQGQQLLIATKILEGTHYVLHPNGSAMFIANVDEPSLDQFPWDTDGDSNPVFVKHAFVGEGIANGYGFRYPGSKPGSLFVIQDGLLAFIWKESRAVLTLQRLNLQELLKKGERVHALPPIANFSYLTKSYSNVFAGFPGS